MTAMLKITLRLLTICLLLTTLGTLAARATESTRRVSVVTTQAPDGYHLLQIWPGFRRAYPLRHDPLTGNLGWSRDGVGRLAYLTTEQPAWLFDYYRLNPSGEPLTLLYGGAVNLKIADSPDGQWMLLSVQPGEEWRYVLIHIPTARRWSLDDVLAPRPLVIANHRFADDSQSLYLIAQADATHELIALNLTDFTVRPVLADLTVSDYPGIHAQIGDWLVVRDGLQYRRVRTDGRDAAPLLTLDPPSLPDAVFDAFPAEGIVLIHRDNRMLAVHVERGEILWERPAFTLGHPATGPAGWLNVWDVDLNFLLHLPTGETRPLPAELQGPSTTRRPIVGNEHWAVYSRSGQEWWVYDWDAGKSHLLRRDMLYFRYVGLAPEGGALLVEDSTPPYGLHRLNLRDGTLEQVASGRGFTYMGWMSPYQPAWRPLPLLLLGVLLLLLPRIAHRLLKSRHHILSPSRGH